MDSDPQIAGPGGKSWFFGIGINEYLHFTPLQNAVKDVEDIAKLLHDRYDVAAEHSLTLYNKEATRKNIIGILDRLQREVGPEDKLIIYYSGHGHLNKEIGKGYWIPTNAERDNTSDYIRNSTIREYIETLNALHTLLISDSCFSGSLFMRGASRSASAINELAAIPSRWALCSGRHNEEVFDGEPGGNSPFAESIIDTLKRNQHKELNIAKLADRVVEQTRANYQQLPEGNPLYGVGHQGGQYIFRLRANESENWATALAEGSIAAFQLFLEKNPDSKHAEEARKKIVRLEEENVWKTAKDKNTSAAYIEYRRDYPEGRHRDEALKAIQELEESEVWQNARRQNTLFGYEQYLEKYPNGQFSQEAVHTMDSLLKEQKMASPKQENTSERKEQAPQQAKHKKATPTPKKASPSIPKKPFLKKHGGLLGGGAVVLLLLILYAAGFFNPSFPKGEVTLGDKTYPTVTIDGLTWLAKNLDYKTKEGTEYGRDSRDNEVVTHFGLLYTQQAAKEACAALGQEWRLPAWEDWEVLAERFGGYQILQEADEQSERKLVPSKGYQKGKNKALTDDGNSGFSADFHVIRYGDGENAQYDSGFSYWSTTKDKESKPDPSFYYIDFGGGGNPTTFRSIYKDAGLACRCVKGTNPNSTPEIKDPIAPEITPVGTKGQATLGGRTYPTIRLNNLTWMAENLDYEVRYSFYNDNLDYNSLKKKYGRMYPWSVGKKVCEDFGWRLPTVKEVEELIEKFGGPEKAYSSLITGGNSGLSLLLAGSRWGHVEEEGAYLALDENYPTDDNGFNISAAEQAIRFYTSGSEEEISGYCRCVKK